MESTRKSEGPPSSRATGETVRQLSGVKRTRLSFWRAAANDPRRIISASFDHLIAATRRVCGTVRPSDGLEVDDKLELGRLQDRPAAVSPKFGLIVCSGCGECR